MKILAETVEAKEPRIVSCMHEILSEYRTLTPWLVPNATMTQPIE